MKKFYLFLFSLMFVVIGCNPDDGGDVVDPPTGSYKVIGKVTYEGQPAAGVQVQLGDVFNWKTTTDANGNFELAGVSHSEFGYSFKAAKTMTNGQVVMKRSKVQIQGDVTDVGTIDLPKPISLNPIDANSSASLNISWVKSNDPNFVEYRLYRKNTAALDDFTGELIYTSSNLNVNTYADNSFRTGTNVYYRLYAVCKNDMFSASNIEFTTVPEINLVQNGSFELQEANGMPSLFTPIIVGTPGFRYFQVTTDLAKTGTYGLKLNYNEALANPPAGEQGWGGIVQQIPAGDLRVGQEYTLSFWSKSNVGSMNVRLFKNSDFEDELHQNTPIVNYIVGNGQEWSEKRFTFRLEEGVTYLQLVINTKALFATGTNGIVEAFIDDVKIIK